jgi:hypothetical protein
MMKYFGKGFVLRFPILRYSKFIIRNSLFLLISNIEYRILNDEVFGERLCPFVPNTSRFEILHSTFLIQHSSFHLISNTEHRILNDEVLSGKVLSYRFPSFEIRYSSFVIHHFFIFVLQITCSFVLFRCF